MGSTTVAKSVDEVEIVEEIDDQIAVKVGKRRLRTECVDEIEIIEEVERSILVEVCGAGDGGNEGRGGDAIKADD